MQDVLHQKIGSVHRLRPTLTLFQARIDDTAAYDKLLSGFSDPAEARRAFAKPYFDWDWIVDRKRDHWLMSDGVEVNVLEISGLSAGEARDLRLIFRGFVDSGACAGSGFEQVPFFVNAVFEGAHRQLLTAALTVAS